MGPEEAPSQLPTAASVYLLQHWILFAVFPSPFFAPIICAVFSPSPLEFEIWSHILLLRMQFIEEKGLLSLTDLAEICAFWASQPLAWLWAQLTQSCVCAQLLSHVQLFVASWTVARQVLLPVEFSGWILEWGATSYTRGSSRRMDWTCDSVSPALAGRFFITSAKWEAWHNLGPLQFPKSSSWPYPGIYFVANHSSIIQGFVVNNQ